MCVCDYLTTFYLPHQLVGAIRAGTKLSLLTILSSALISDKKIEINVYSLPSETVLLIRIFLCILNATHWLDSALVVHPDLSLRSPSTM